MKKIKELKAWQAKMSLVITLVIAVVVTGLKKRITNTVAVFVITGGLYCGIAIHMIKEWIKKMSLVDKLKMFFDKPLKWFVGFMVSVLIAIFIPNLSELGIAMLKLISKNILIAITVIIMLCDKKLRAIAKENKRLFTVDFLIFTLTSKIYSLVFIKGFYSDMIYVEIPRMWLYAQAIGIFTAVLWVGVSFGFAYLFTDGKIVDVLKDRYSEKIESIVKFADTVKWKAKRLVG